LSFTVCRFAIVIERNFFFWLEEATTIREFPAVDIEASTNVDAVWRQNSMSMRKFSGEDENSKVDGDQMTVKPNTAQVAPAAWVKADDNNFDSWRNGLMTIFIGGESFLRSTWYSASNCRRLIYANENSKSQARFDSMEIRMGFEISLSSAPVAASSAVNWLQLQIWGVRDDSNMSRYWCRVGLRRSQNLEPWMLRANSQSRESRKHLH
jgi:hypothetical protein